MTRSEDCMKRILAWKKLLDSGETTQTIFAERVEAIAQQYENFLRQHFAELPEVSGRIYGSDSEN